MKKALYLLAIVTLIWSCKERQEPVVFTKYDESAVLEKQQEHKLSLIHI